MPGYHAQKKAGAPPFTKGGKGKSGRKPGKGVPPAKRSLMQGGRR